MSYAVLWTIYGVIAKSSQDLHFDMGEVVAWSREIEPGLVAGMVFSILSTRSISGRLSHVRRKSTPASGGPVLPALADGDRPDGIKGLGQDTLLEPCPRQRSILQLDALQVGPAYREPREVQAAQVAAQGGEEGDHVGRTIREQGPRAQ